MTLETAKQAYGPTYLYLGIKTFRNVSQMKWRQQIEKSQYKHVQPYIANVKSLT